MRDHVVLGGPMGSGKSTLAPLLGARLGVPVVDVDSVLAKDAGLTIGGLFEQVGESRFRRLEAGAIRRALDGLPAVIAVGGGALEDRALRHAVLDRARVLQLTAPLSTLVERVGAGADRPLLRGDVADNLARWIERRRASALECDAVVSTEGGVAESVDRLIGACCLAEHTLVAPLGDATHAIELDAPTAHLRQRVARLAASTVVGVIDAGAAAWARPLLAELGIDETLLLSGGEAVKSLDHVVALTRWLRSAGVDRESVVLVVGGGALLDVVGFVASTFMRGVRTILVPTTLLAMVDATLGGKTAIDCDGVKNLVGTFHPPSHVVLRTDALASLGPRELRSGLIEAYKMAFLAGEAEVAHVEAHSAGVLLGSPGAFRAVIESALRMKLGIVSQDPRESGMRRLLNLGHTFGHAFEAAGHGRLLHGEAVGLGMVAMARFAGHTQVAERIASWLRVIGLDPALARAYDANAAIAALRADKKSRGELVRVVLPRAPGECVIESVACSLLEGFVAANCDFL